MNLEGESLVRVGKWCVIAGSAIIIPDAIWITAYFLYTKEIFSTLALSGFFGGLSVILIGFGIAAIQSGRTALSEAQSLAQSEDSGTPG